jgi:hypothetical protein
LKLNLDDAKTEFFERAYLFEYRRKRIKSETQVKPQTPKGALKPNKMNSLIFSLQYNYGTQEKVNRNSVALKK